MCGSKGTYKLGTNVLSEIDTKTKQRSDGVHNLYTEISTEWMIRRAIYVLQREDGDGGRKAEMER